jgi:hypothetical protein
MADLTGSLGVNYQKAQASSLLGTHELAYFTIDMRQDVATDYLLPNSLYSHTIRALQQRIEMYVIGQPSGNWFTVIAAAITAPYNTNQYAQDGERVQVLEDLIADATGVSGVRVWNAALNGNSFSWDD